MRETPPRLTFALAAIPYLLLSSSQQAGIITHVNPDGSGERLVYARTASGRAGEALKHVGQVLPGCDAQRVVNESGERSLAWRDAHVANLAKVGQIETADIGIVQNPFSIFTRHVWKETLTFDRGEATDVEVHGQGLAKLSYVVRMPGTILTSSPAGKVEDGKVSWDVKVGPSPQSFSVESRTVRWAYAALLLYVLIFLVTKGAVYLPRAAGRIRRKPRKI